MFTIVNSLAPVQKAEGGMRIVMVMPHFVYVFQKEKLKPGDVEVHALAGIHEGECRLEFKNVSQKLARVQSIQSKGFKKNMRQGGYLVLPGKTRWVTMETVAAKEHPEFDIQFERGYRLKVPYTPETIRQ
jgi:hypothetical protein